MSTQSFDLDALRARLAKATGKTYWRSLDELADNEEFHSFLDREFPRQAQAFDGGLDRRTFLKLMGASLAMAGLTGCEFALRQPQQKILPYVRLPEEIIPGKPLFFATTMLQGGYGFGAIAETHEGRPTKLEGNSTHPATLGASNVFLQATTLTLYDPDRSTGVLNKGAQSNWDAFKQAIQPIIQQKKASQGAGLRILSETVTSPTLAAQLTTMLGAMPQARWVQYEPAGMGNALQGAFQAFGEYVEPVYDLSKANVVLALDADFMAEGPGQIRYARQFIDRRRAEADKNQINRLYAAEPTPTFTGTAADHRLQIRPADVEALARTIAQAVGALTGTTVITLGEKEQKFATAVAADLQANRGTSLVIAGLHQPPVVHALAHAINQQLGNSGQTVNYIEAVAVSPQNQADTFRQLVQEMDGGQVDTLIILGSNPVYTAPADLNFAAALGKVANSVHLGLFVDETAGAATWHINENHELESWGDARAFDGTESLIQPMIEPLYAGKTAAELIATLDGRETSAYQLVRATWQPRLTGNFEQAWEAILQNGVVPSSAAQPKSVTLAATFDTPSGAAVAEGLQLLFRPDGTIGDGRWANNPWLQELPKPMTKLVWDNAVLLSPRTAQAQGVSNGDIVTVTNGGLSVSGPVWVLPGQAEGVVTVHLGYGRKTGGKIASGATGFNAYAIRTAAAPWFVGGVTLAKTGGRLQLVSTQDHNAMEGRNFIISAPVAEYKTNPEIIHELHGEHEDITLYPRKAWEGIQWGMSIDLNACIGCGVCSIACQAENNIGVAGKDQVSRGRELIWIRIDRYFEGASLDEPEIVHQPVTCMHCENAPCESVCPVAATVHSADGLNTMVYNRCVGTRYCSNNCPYKVRRYNFFQYTLQPRELFGNSELQIIPEQHKLARNPNVTVRSRGVMEKCTYCSQRIATARQDAERLGVELKDGDVITACQQACPTQAIVFGNINDPNSRVAQLKAQKLNYTLLDELNVKPRTSYQGKIRNPNPELGEA